MSKRRHLCGERLRPHPVRMPGQLCGPVLRHSAGRYGVGAGRLLPRRCRCPRHSNHRRHRLRHGALCLLPAQAQRVSFFLPAVTYIVERDRTRDLIWLKVVSLERS